MSIASLHPLLKLGLGAVLVVAGSAVIQSAAWAVGHDFNILQAGNGQYAAQAELARGRRAEACARGRSA